jgi:hypothetical protein
MPYLRKEQGKEEEEEGSQLPVTRAVELKTTGLGVKLLLLELS